MLFKAENGIAAKILAGFTTLLCFFHIISLPFMYNEWPFTSLYWLFLSGVIAICIAYCLLSFLKKRVPLKADIKTLIESIRDTVRNRWWQYRSRRR